ncbi:hypothetical protein AGMMS4957_05930 [Bacteroidia bacterium]|nr:hypothetical protein AGMMS4957_05930 [Bacteroidia bacterium]
MKFKMTIIAVMIFSVSGYIPKASAQTEVMAWGNFTGIRIDGQLIDFESSICVVGKDKSFVYATGKERQFRPQYIRNGQTQTVTTEIAGIRFTEAVTDLSKGKARVTIDLQSDTTLNLDGVYFHLQQPPGNNGQSVKIGDKKGSQDIVIAKGKIKRGQKAHLSFEITASGTIDNEPATITVATNKPGREFLGLGGNFRLQNPAVDPQVIDYCLDSLRVAYGRVEMPWRSWQPDAHGNPLADALAGKLDERVKAAMNMAQRLKRLGMPVIVSAWFPPAWAIDGKPEDYPRRGGVQAFRLDPRKAQQVYKSLTDYLLALKTLYGVEAAAFSFNESDIGIDVLHTPEEHAEFIKGLGGYMASKGLSTKMLLGDNSDATTYEFILPAMRDPETHPYIAAVSFHSWRGCDDATLEKWAAASRELNVPLLVGEGSTDAAAWVYPQIFKESTFALYEINLYMRIAAICQPQSILQWQLTSDYSLLWGAGVYGSEGALQPTQRFWNLKQLASTPEQAFAFPVSSSKKEVNTAAFGNIARNEYVVHAVNNGAARSAVIKGLPTGKASIKVYVTNQAQGMEEVRTYKSLPDGSLEVQLPAMSFVSVFIKGNFSYNGQAQLTSVLEILDVNTGNRKTVKEFDHPIEAPNWTPDGKSLVYNSGGKLYKLSLENQGEPEVINTDFATNCNNDHVISADGKYIAISNSPAEDHRSRVYTVPFEGGVPTLITELAPSYLHGISPDNKFLAYCAERNGNYDVYAIPFKGGKEIRLTTAEGLDDGPEYSPDGKYIWFNSVRSGLMQVWRMKADGSEQTQMTFDETRNSWFPHVSPDGKQVIFIAYTKGDLKPNEHLPNKNVELRLMSATGGAPQTVAKLFGGQGTINVNSWSPDSKRIAFVSYRVN